MYYNIENGQIKGIFTWPQEGMDLLPEDSPVVKKALADKANADADAAVRLEAYGYARARAAAYIQAFGKDPSPSAADAMGHVLDAILSHFAGDSTDLMAIQAKRSEIKAAHPKGQ